MKRGRSWIIGISISLVALGILFWGLDFRTFVEVLSAASYQFLLPALTLLVLGLLARAQSWKILLGDSVSFRRTFSALNEGYLLNSILPFRLGEISRAYLVAQDSEDIRFGQALSTVVIERLLDFAVSLGALFISLYFLSSVEWVRDLALAATAFIAVFVAALYILVSNQTRLENMLARVPAFSRWRLGEFVEDFSTGLQLVRRPTLLLKAGLWSTAAWITAWIQLTYLLRAFGQEGGIIVSFFVVGVTAIGVAIPSSPGSIGVFELSAVAALVFLGYPREAALGVAIVGHALQLTTTAVLGGFALAREGETLVGLAGKAQKAFDRLQESPTS